MALVTSSFQSYLRLRRSFYDHPPPQDRRHRRGIVGMGTWTLTESSSIGKMAFISPLVPSKSHGQILIPWVFRTYDCQIIQAIQKKRHMSQTLRSQLDWSRTKPYRDWFGSRSPNLRRLQGCVDGGMNPPLGSAETGLVRFYRP